MDDNFSKTLQQLQTKVSQFTDNSSKSTTYKSNMSKFSNQLNKKALLIYGGPFLLVLLVLFFWKPKFITHEAEDEEGVYTVKTNFRKLLVTTVIMGVIIDILIFLYLRKKEIKLL